MSYMHGKVRIKLSWELYAREDSHKAIMGAICRERYIRGEP